MYQVGKVYRRGDKLIYIIDKKPMSMGINNFYIWREVKKSGKLGKEDWGYGESSEPVKCEIDVKIKLTEVSGVNFE